MAIRKTEGTRSSGRRNGARPPGRPPRTAIKEDETPKAPAPEKTLASAAKTAERAPTTAIEAPAPAEVAEKAQRLTEVSTATLATAARETVSAQAETAKSMARAGQATVERATKAASESLGVGTDESAAARAFAAPFTALAESGLAQARQTYAAAREQQEAWNRGVFETAQATSRGISEINGKMLDLVRSQTDATFGLWRDLIGVTSFAEAVEIQTREMRRQYEDASSRMKDIAETATRIAQEVATPVTTVFPGTAGAQR